MHIRIGEPTDIQAISKVHVASWQSTYKGIIDEKHLSGLTVEQGIRRWQRTFEHPYRDQIIYVAAGSNGKIAGFVTGGACRESDMPYEAEIYALYLLEEAQGSGCGRRLCTALAEELMARGYRSMMVWVLTDNPSIGFYRRLGGQFISEKPIKIGSGTLMETALGWSDMTLLGRKSGAEKPEG